jgi:hypothetical protein
MPQLTCRLAVNLVGVGNDDDGIEDAVTGEDGTSSCCNCDCSSESFSAGGSMAVDETLEDVEGITKGPGREYDDL